MAEADRRKMQRLLSDAVKRSAREAAAGKPKAVRSWIAGIRTMVRDGVTLPYVSILAEAEDDGEEAPASPQGSARGVPGGRDVDGAPAGRGGLDPDRP